MENQDEVEKAVMLLGGRRVIPAIVLAEWFGLSPRELYAVMGKNNVLMDPAFVIRLDEEEMERIEKTISIRSKEIGLTPSFVFTIHGIILLCACLDDSDTELLNRRMVRILSILNTGFSAG